MQKKYFWLFVCVGAFFALGMVYTKTPSIVHAATNPAIPAWLTNRDSNLETPEKTFQLIGPIISLILDLALFAGALTAFAFFIYGAIQWGTAGSGDGAAAGRKTMIYAAVGFVLLGLVYALIFLINQILPHSGAQSHCGNGTCQSFFVDFSQRSFVSPSWSNIQLKGYNL